MKNNDQFNQFWDGGCNGHMCEDDSEFVFAFDDGTTHTCKYSEFKKPSDTHIFS